MKKILLIFAGLFIAISGFSQVEGIRPTVVAGDLKITGQDTTGEMLYYDLTTDSWKTTYGAYLKWSQATRVLQLGANSSLGIGTEIISRYDANGLQIGNSWHVGDTNFIGSTQYLWQTTINKINGEGSFEVPDTVKAGVLESTANIRGANLTLISLADDASADSLITIEDGVAKKSAFSVIIDTAQVLFKYDTTKEAASAKIATKYDIDTTYNLIQPLIDQFWHGVQWDITSGATPLTKIGNTTYQTSLPVHTEIQYGCVKNDKTVNYYLDKTDFTKKQNGAASVLTGTDGQVMMIMPAHYRKWEQDGNTRRVKISPYALSGFTLVPSYAIGIYEAKSITGDTLSSISGQTPTTSLTRAVFRTRAAKRGTGWSQLSYNAYKALMVLYLCEKANWNSQDATMLGTGATNAVSVDWSEYNAYAPVMTSGQNNASGAYTGNKNLTINNWYAGTASATKTDTLIDAGRFATSWLGGYINDTLINATTGDSAVITAKLTNDTLVLTTFYGSGVYTSGDRYYVLNSTLATYIAYYRGVENVFGHVWKFVDGININSNVVYKCSTPANFADDTQTNYTLIGTASNANGYIARLLYGSIIPSVSTGGSSSTYICDYYYQAAGWRVACWGGRLYSGADAGLWAAKFNDSSDYASAYIGARLCLKIE